MSASSVIYANHEIRFAKRAGTYSVYPPHSEVVALTAGLATVEDARRWIDGHILAVKRQNEFDPEWDD